MDILGYLEKQPLRAFLFAAGAAFLFCADKVGDTDNEYREVYRAIAFALSPLCAIYFIWDQAGRWRRRASPGSGNAAPDEDAHRGRTIAICSTLAIAAMVVAFLSWKPLPTPASGNGTSPPVDDGSSPAPVEIERPGRENFDRRIGDDSGGATVPTAPRSAPLKPVAAAPPTDASKGTVSEIFVEAPSRLVCNVSAGTLACPQSYWVRIGRRVDPEGGTDLGLAPGLSSGRFRSISDLDAAVAERRSFAVDRLSGKSCSAGRGPASGGCGNLSFKGTRSAMEKQEDEDGQFWIRIGSS